MRGWIIRRLGGEFRSDGIPTVEVILGTQDKSWHPEHIRSRRLDTEEKLHLQRLWLALSKGWLVVGNAALWATAVLIDVLNPPGSARWLTYLYVVAVASIVLSPTWTYIQYKRVQKSQLTSRKLGVLLRAVTEQQVDQEDSDNPEAAVLIRQRRYRDETIDVITQYRDEANRNRRTSIRFQAIIIVGSIGASAITTASVSFMATRWISVGVTAANAFVTSRISGNSSSTSLLR